MVSFQVTGLWQSKGPFGLWCPTPEPRLAHLGVEFEAESSGETYVFMNHPQADESASKDDQRCVGTITYTLSGTDENQD